MGNTPVGHLTQQQKDQGVAMRRKKINYDIIAETLGVEPALLRYRLLQHLRITHPELLGRKAKVIGRVTDGMNNEDIVHYRHNPPGKVVNNKASEVKIRIDKEEVAKRLAELGLAK